MSDNIYIIGVGMTKFGKHLDKGVKQLTGLSLDLVLKDCGLEKDAIEAAWFSNTGWGMSEFQHSIRGQVALSANGLDKISMVNVENACASGSTALHSGWMAIKAGVYDCVLAIGTEKMYYDLSKATKEQKAKSFKGFIAGTDVEETTRWIEKWQEDERKKKEQMAEEAKKKGVEVKKDDSKKGHSVFMDFYAAGARNHMKAYGTTQRQLAVIASKAHNNSTLNPLAQYTFPQTVEQVMEDREVAYPLTRAMCAPVGDGSAAAIICSERFLKKHSTDRAVLIRASILKSGKRTGDNDVCQRAADAAYETAGLGPEDINVVEVHDATAFGELYQTEQMGFCPVGEGGPFAESGATALDGKIPVNTSGGLMSRGHPIGASGIAQTWELVTQLRGEAGKRQIKKHKIAMAENGGGTLGNGEASMAIHILEKI
ncbi:MAG: thiolase family protein [Deltaproteobacteria bacterium]|nr:thiolase family protein [Deltaproteobacteria bacterium]MBW1846403.1 thiolase family protein [Deltaproteobacteria bacterium]MBW1983827.1 thiolase family protein [Deltaproteobacteria bacterium]MBW2180225.1 thiolase family protein [Deltaproteobacteria bacterium]MBW2365895.1 thiolase family protein [Deltaproteobacteria bacterium]